jgi:hypothetical protein
MAQAVVKRRMKDESSEVMLSIRQDRSESCSVVGTMWGRH